MYRFIAFAWNHRNAERDSLAKTHIGRLASALPEMECALAVDGLHVFHAGGNPPASQAYVLCHDAGVILGKVFKRRTNVDSDLHAVAFGQDETRRIQESQGRHLITDYWGRYVALLKDPDGGRFRVLRDPTGGISCLSTNFRGINVVCSSADDGARLGLITPVINWDHVAAYLWSPRLVTKSSGLDGVRQVLAGECIVTGGEKTTASFYWSPDRVHEMRVVDDHTQAMRELHDTIQYSVQAWASCYSNILHSLSGGLDSAVVLACLATTSRTSNVVCENYYTKNETGDERIFARMAADHAAIELIETPLRSTELAIENMLNTTRFATPTLTRLTLEVEAIREQLVKKHNFEAVFSGQGGDHFFQQWPTPLIAAEYAWRHGLRPGLMRVVSDTSRFTRRPIWSVMATALSAGILRRHADPYDQRFELQPLVPVGTREAMDLTEVVRHPWLDSASDLPDVKIGHIVSIIDTQNFLCVPRDYADFVHPLISQPVIELCLQIPSYVLTYGGIDRALVRGAFDGAVPSKILSRTVKGATTSYYSGLLIANIPFLRDYLLSGLLVGNGLLDKEVTEATLTESSFVRNSQLIVPVLNAIKAEAWLRTWISDGQRAAA